MDFINKIDLHARETVRSSRKMRALDQQTCDPDHTPSSLGTRRGSTHLRMIAVSTTVGKNVH